jgi:hypothetical protein
MRDSTGWARTSCRALLASTLIGLPVIARAQSRQPTNSLRGAPPAAQYRLGVWIEPVSQWNGQSWVPSGLRITGVSPGSPAEQAGVRTGNVLTSVNGSQVSSLTGLLTALANSGGRLSLGLREGGRATTREIKSFAWAPPLSRRTPQSPTTYYAPAYGTPGSLLGPRRVIRRPFYSNYGDAPSPNPFSTPPSYGDIVR